MGKIDLIKGGASSASAHATAAAMAVSRRGFLVGMAASVAMFGFPRDALAAMDPAQPLGVPLEPDGAAFEPTIWYWIDGAGRINVNIINAEMGQHVGTGVARILAAELGANWDDVHITHVDSDAKWGTMVTGGSWSIWMSWGIYRQAAAAGRTALIEKAADIWGIPVAGITVAQSVVHGPEGRSAGFGELVTAGIARSFTEDELKALPLRPVSELTLLKQEVQALDIRAKTTGQAVYGIDAKVEGMVYGAPILPPTRNGCTISALDDSAAKAVKGFRQVLRLDDPSGTTVGWAMVIADSHWAALKASELVTVTYDLPPEATVTEAQIQAENLRLIEDGSLGALVETAGNPDVDPVFAAAADILEADYTTSSVLHYALEPMNAIALRNGDGVWEILTGNQWQSLCLPWIAKALDVPQEQVVMRSHMLGGGFGRRLNGDYCVPVALASKALGGKPVKMVLTREQDSLFDSFRSPSMARLRMAFDADKQVVAMDSTYAAGWPTKVMAADGLAKGLNGEPYDPFASDGGEHWYEVGGQRMRVVSNELANTTFRPGWLRSVSPGWINFMVESFMDETAHHIGADPLQFRLDHFTAEGANAGSAPNAVGGAKRQAAVLSRVAELSGYGKADLPADTAIGLATTFGQSRSMPTWVAGAVQLRVDRKTGFVDIQKVWIVVDCGVVVDPNGAHAQTEGAALWGISMALFEGTSIENGVPADLNLATYTPLRMIDAPQIEIEFVDSTEVPTGLGEPGTTVIAPAIANALYNAVGVRMRHLPILPADVLKALGPQSA